MGGYRCAISRLFIKHSWLELLAIDAFDWHLFYIFIMKKAYLSFTVRHWVHKDHFHIIFLSSEGAEVCIMGLFKQRPSVQVPCQKDD